MLSRYRLLVVALVLGAVVRAAYFVWSQDLPFFQQPITDALYHHRLAMAMAEGTWWDGHPFFRAPFYPWVLGILYRLFGAHIWIGKVFGHAVGLATGGLIIAFADRVAGRRAAVVAAVLWLGSGLLIFFEGELLVDSLFTLGSLGSLYLAFTSVEHPRRLAGAGWMLGLAAVTRPTILIIVPVLFWWLWRRGSVNRRSAVWAVAFLSVPVLFVSILNSVAVGRPAGIAAQGGINFYIGNNPAADGYTAVLPEPWGYAWDYDALTRHASWKEGRPLDPFETSAYYYRRGLAFVVENPMVAAKRALKKILLSINRVEISNNLNLPYVTRRLPVLGWLGIRTAWLVPLALAALWLPCRDREARLGLWAVIASYTLVFALFFVNERFRLPLVPIWIVLAAGAGAWSRNTPRRITGRMLATLGAAVVACSVNWYGLIPDNEAFAHFNLGNQALRSGRNAEALAHYDSAAVWNPDLRQLHLNRGLAFLRSGRPGRAREEFTAEARRYPYDARPYNNLAAVALLEGDTAAAMRDVDSGWVRDSGLVLLHLQRLAVLAAREDTLRLGQALRRARRLVGEHPAWPYWAGEWYRLRGHNDSARMMYRSYVARRDPWPKLLAEGDQAGRPRPADVDYRIGLTYLGDGVLDSLDYYFARAAWADSGFAAAWSNWGTAALSTGSFQEAMARYRVALRADPAAPVVWTNLALAYLALGHRDSARVALTAALHVDSNFAPARDLRLRLDSLPPPPH